jgi:hypothetical protein
MYRVTFNAVNAEPDWKSEFTGIFVFIPVQVVLETR